MHATLKFTIVGVSPLVMHNEQLADPLNKWTREVAQYTSKRKKSVADHEKISELEWYGGLYLVRNGTDILVPGVPSRCLERMIRDAAVKSKEGKDVQAALIVPNDATLEYKGSKDPKAMWASGSFALRATCAVNRKRIIRTRPMFMEWRTTFSVLFDETILNPSKVKGYVTLAGRIIGLMDWRPKHGRFDVESVG